MAGEVSSASTSRDHVTMYTGPWRLGAAAEEHVEKALGALCAPPCWLVTSKACRDRGGSRCEGQRLGVCDLLVVVVAGEGGSRGTDQGRGRDGGAPASHAHSLRRLRAHNRRRPDTSA